MNHEFKRVLSKEARIAIKNVSNIIKSVIDVRSFLSDVSDMNKYFDPAWVMETTLKNALFL